MDERPDRAGLVHVQAGAADLPYPGRNFIAGHVEPAARCLQPTEAASIAQRLHARRGVADYDREETKTEVARSHAAAVAGSDKVAKMIGLALSAITLGFSAGNGEKIAISGLARRRIDGGRVVKEQICGGTTVVFLPRNVAGRRCGRGQHIVTPISSFGPVAKGEAALHTST